MNDLIERVVIQLDAVSETREAIDPRRDLRHGGRRLSRAFLSKTRICSAWQSSLSHAK
jgi:hypothetical protein